MESSEQSASWNVIDVPGSRRYELRRSDELIGYATYASNGEVITIPHVETLVEHRGNRYSEILMAGIVDDARNRSLRIDPICPYLATYLRRRDDAADVVAG